MITNSCGNVEGLCSKAACLGVLTEPLIEHGKIVEQLGAERFIIELCRQLFSPLERFAGLLQLLLVQLNFSQAVQSPRLAMQITDVYQYSQCPLLCIDCPGQVVPGQVIAAQAFKNQRLASLITLHHF